MRIPVSDLMERFRELEASRASGIWGRERIEVLLVYVDFPAAASLAGAAAGPLGFNSVAEAEGVMDGLRAKAEANDVTLMRGDRRKEPTPEPEDEVTLTLKKKRNYK